MYSRIDLILSVANFKDRTSWRKYTFQSASAFSNGNKKKGGELLKERVGGEDLLGQFVPRWITNQRTITCRIRHNFQGRDQLFHLICLPTIRRRFYVERK